MSAAQTMPDARGRFGKFGGRYVPETLIPVLDDVTRIYNEAKNDPVFQAELHRLLVEFVGRPTQLTFAAKLSAMHKRKIYLKREDLCHT